MNEAGLEDLRKRVPQTFGEALDLYPWLKCEPHEWDNRTTLENAHWLLGFMCRDKTP